MAHTILAEMESSADLERHEGWEGERERWIPPGGSCVDLSDVEVLEANHPNKLLAILVPTLPKFA